MTGARPGRSSLGFELAGWGLALLSLLWAYLVHQGIGPSPDGLELRWFEPRGYMHARSWLGWAFESTPRLLGVLLFPSAALAAGVFIAGRSSVARGLSLASGVAVLLFGFYGVEAVKIWELFFWRGSAVLAVTALAIGFALAAPLLAQSWLRLSWPLRIATYLLPALIVVAFVRNATGTDPDLRFSISPWPAIAFYGIEVGAFFITLVYAAAAVAAGGVLYGIRQPERRVPAVLAGIALGLLGPPTLLWLWGAAGLPPFRVDFGISAVLTITCAIVIALAVLPRVRDPEALKRRATGLAVGAALLAVPILGGQVRARLDYYWTREHRAREIIDAMERYYEREKLYPDVLVQLIEAGDLEALPRPAIGFSFLYEGDFGYSSFGTSYLLDFPAPRWVECAYTPPYEDDENEFHPAPSKVPEAGEAGLDESWSCPKRPPELW